MQWDFKTGIPIYQQIMDHFRLDIASGSLSPGARIPSVRELAEEAGVNPNTMQRALSELEREGLITTERTTGKYITEDTERLEAMRRDISHQLISELLRRLGTMGFSKEEIMKTITDVMEKEQE